MLVKEKTAFKALVNNTRKKFVFGRTFGENVLKEKFGVNCEIKDGSISCGMGVVPYVCEDTAEDIFTGALPQPQLFFPAWQTVESGESGENGYALRVGALTTTGTIYYYDGESDTWKKDGTIGENVSVVSLVDENKVMKTAFVGKSGVYLYEVGKPIVKVYHGETTGAGCFFKGRLFVAVKPFHLAYSSPYEPHIFDEGLYTGGKITFPADAGEVVQMAVLKDKLYVFYERGIAVVEATGSAFDLRFEKKLYTGGKILAGSVGVCGVGKERLFFLAENGVYAFDGVASKKVCNNVEVLPKRNTRVCGQASFEGKYFVCFYDEDGQERGLVVDGESGEGCYAFAPSSVSVFDGRALCVADGKVQELSLRGDLPTGEKCVWESECMTFEKAQYLKRLSVFGKGRVICYVGCGKSEKKVVLRADGENVARLSLRGKRVWLRFELERGTILQGVVLSLQTLRASK